MQCHKHKEQGIKQNSVNANWELIFVFDCIRYLNYKVNEMRIYS
jgi:hypothetical protein